VGEKIVNVAVAGGDGGGLEVGVKDGALARAQATARRRKREDETRMRFMVITHLTQYREIHLARQGNMNVAVLENCVTSGDK
jgi:hypothetical protein